MAEPSEEDATPEERLAWLRARGVTIEEFGQKQLAQPTGDSHTFLFVKIPAEEGSLCEERTGRHSTGDALPVLLGPEFAGCTLSDDELRAHAAAAGQQVDISILRSLMNQGRAEGFRLAVPTDANGNQDVYAYLDEASSLKGLPRNERASAIAHNCGFPQSCEFFGDVYIGRRKWRSDGIVENVDFRLSDLQPGALWMRRAVTENLEFQKATRPDEHAAAQASADIAQPASGKGDGYTWKDDNEEVELVLSFPEETAKKDIKIEFKRQEVLVSRPLSMSLKLWRPIDVDGCNWTVAKPGQVLVTLAKDTASAWTQLLA